MASTRMARMRVLPSLPVGDFSLRNRRCVWKRSAPGRGSKLNWTTSSRAWRLISRDSVRTTTEHWYLLSSDNIDTRCYRISSLSRPSGHIPHQLYRNWIYANPGVYAICRLASSDNWIRLVWIKPRDITGDPAACRKLLGYCFFPSVFGTTQSRTLRDKVIED